jgi:hypothetical protein
MHFSIISCIYQEHLLHTGVILFGSDQEVGELMKAVKRRNATGMFSWIGSDGWGGRGLAYHGKEQQVNMFLFLKIDGIR